ncbi:tetratricopeptide repeat family protein [Paraburkholderia fungorum]|uniref:protein O-GlcNAc transferase n=1 Tax=Paraburkholderia fungorum TaxID=134537 RepID=A0AAU8T0S7_9BURK|nr:tetratricopeptide repeat family protein [Paraburkholderia fungorum]
MTLLYEQPTADLLTPDQQLEQDIVLVLQAALEHHHKGEFDEAEALYQAILEAKPTHPDVNYNLGVLRVQTSRPTEALQHFELVLGIAPRNGQYWVAYINALIDAGQTPAAWLALEMGQQQGLNGQAVDGLIARMASPESVIQTFAAPLDSTTPAVNEQTGAELPAAPGEYAAEPSTTGIIAGRKVTPQDRSRLTSLYNNGRVVEAIKLTRTLTQRYPTDNFAWRWLGIALHRHGQYADAVEPLRKAAELLPDDLECQMLLADTLRIRSRYAEAEQVCRAMIAINPEHAEGHRILGMTLVAQGRVSDGLVHSRYAVELTPDLSIVHSSLGVVLLDLGFVQEAEQCFHQALKVAPTDPVSRNNLLFTLTHNPEIDPETLLIEHLKFAEIHEAPVHAQWPRHANNRNPKRRLKIGLVSGDLFRHAVSSYLMPIMEHLAKDASLSLHVYNNHTFEDDRTEVMRGFATQWDQITGLTDAQLANRIRDDRIDILFDLSGHTGRNRLLTFARKPAPVQVSWMGYPATSGLSAMDYYFADQFAVPFGPIERQFTEKIVHLPSSAAFQPEKNSPPVNILPAMHNGYITFGSFNRLNKLRPDVIALWAQLLRSVPLSRMLVGSITTPEDEIVFTDWFAKEGITRDRLTFRPRTIIPVYLQQHFHVDICLDTFPYTGSTTVLNSLWMGVPTLTIAGNTVASRAGTTWLSHVGLEEFVAANKEEFIAKGTALASDIPKLAAIRTGLRERCSASAAFRTDVVAAGVSRALRIMWERWCSGQSAAPFEVPMEAVTGTAYETPSPSSSGENK